ncbi:MAG TPA: amidohydrolase family protein [Candidatus Nitrosotalea sp.]|nr:amidohydrolase family protein [Candidatus Nitrosotalea sp.]
MRIDSHNHALPPAAIELVQHRPEFGIEIKDGRMSSFAHVPTQISDSIRQPRAKLREMEQARLEGAVVSIAPTFFGYKIEPALGEELCRVSNAGLAEFAAEDPTHFRWMAHVPMQDAELAARVLSDAAALGCVGVEVATSVAGRPLDGPEIEPFWAQAERLGLPVMIHPMYNQPHPLLDQYYLQNVIGNPLATTIAAERLICAGVLDRYPGLRILLVHASGFYPFQAGRLRHAASVRPELQSAPPDPWVYAGRLLSDTVTHDVTALTYLIQRMGEDNVMIGTDQPFDMGTPHPVDELEAAVDGALARKIAEENPARIFGFK